MVVPATQLLASVSDASGGASQADLSGRLYFDACRLSDSESVLVHRDSSGNGKVRVVGTGASTLAVSAASTFGTLATFHPPLVTRLDATHALVVWAGGGSFGVPLNAVVVTSNGSSTAPTVGTVFSDSAFESTNEKMVLVGLSASLAVYNAFSGGLTGINVSGTTVTSFTVLNDSGQLDAVGDVKSLVRLSSTRFLAVAQDETLTNYNDITVVDLSSGTTASPTTVYHPPFAPFSIQPLQPGWVLGDGRVVQQVSGVSGWLIDPNGMSGPIVNARSFSSPLFSWGSVSVGPPAAFTDNPLRLIQPLQGRADGTTGASTDTGAFVSDVSALATSLTYAFPTNPNALAVPLSNASFAVTVGLDGRVLAVAPDASTGVAVLMLLAPVPAAAVGGWKVGSI